ncbi:xylulokinase [Ancylobacter defluvii]|uniref:Xylulose kinase n=1 Tax=Ancylobacter defluvii TaxID=1282440 RepID=A0A9W6K1Z6_9HYPH|nr:xylulokinase [Ancylobacter defluvii]MBS7588347.1 xylulokinase [Ancylobacter defluvii]GLK86751.1 xylulokinase [Ancylobacter defluvii]
MFVGLDIGTSAIKAVLVDETQAVLATAEVPLSVSRPQPGHSEQNPEDWWQATLASLDQLKAARPVELAAVKGIGLSGQMHGAVLLDASGAVLRPAILWNDGRSAAECVELEAAFLGLHTVTGNLAFPGFTAPKLLWLRKHEPDIFARTAKVLLPKAYVGYRLTGEMVEEMSDASGTLWLDVGKRDWSDAALAATGLDRSHMPRLVEGSEVAARITPELAARWGMATPPVLAGGAGDNAAGAVGLGAIHAGNAFVSLGTSGVLWATTDRFAPNPQSSVHAFCHAIPATWHQMGVILSAASALGWWAQTEGISPGDLLRPLGDAPVAPSRAIFLPYLSGERTPHNDTAIRGAFVGLDHETTREALTQAVLEGVAFAFRDCLDALNAAGTTLATADVIGGGSRSRYWTAVIANVLGLPINRIEDGERGGAFGAARLARMAATGESPAAICLPPRRIETIAPTPALQQAYAEKHARYRALYPALKGVTS